MSAEGLRKRRTAYFVQVNQSVTRNDKMSYRALGLLTHLLGLPDGWDVRSEVLARGEGREGREAIRTTLRELAAHGHYRLERRRTLDGRNVMGTAISEMPVPEWIAEFEEFDGKAIPVVQQPDGSWLVKHLDGTLTGDGFPGAGLPDSGFPGPLSKKEKQDIHTSSLRSDSSSLRSVESPGSHDSDPQVPEAQPALIAAPTPPDGPGARQDVDSLCNHLAYRIEHNGSKPPTITAGWRKAARLLLDSDRRDLTEAHWLIDWCQDDTFWQSNILSMTKFRQKYDQLRLKARQQVSPEPRRPVVYIDFGAEAANG